MVAERSGDGVKSFILPPGRRLRADPFTRGGSMKVALLMGGRSSEREISLRTGRGIAQALRNLGHEVLAVDAANGRLLPAGEEEKSALPPEAVEKLPASSTSAVANATAINEAEVVFIGLHGGAGGDRAVQDVLEVVGQPTN